MRPLPTYAVPHTVWCRVLPGVWPTSSDFGTLGGWGSGSPSPSPLFWSAICGVRGIVFLHSVNPLLEICAANSVPFCYCLLQCPFKTQYESLWYLWDVSQCQTQCSMSS